MKKLLFVSLCSMVLAFGAAAHLQASTVVNLLGNSDFDDGQGVSWLEYSHPSHDILMNPIYIVGPWAVKSPHTGTDYAWLGGYADLIQYLYQDVYIPPATTNLSMSFFAWIETAYPGLLDDYFSLTIRSPTNNEVLETLIELDWVDYSIAPWTEFNVNITGDYAGDTIRIFFGARTDPNFSTNFFIDSTALNATVPIPGALWLLGSGLVALVGFRWKKQ